MSAARRQNIKDDIELISDLLERLSEKRNHRQVLELDIETISKQLKTRKAELDTCNDEIDKIEQELTGHRTLGLFTTPSVTKVTEEEGAQDPAPSQSVEPAQQEAEAYPSSTELLIEVIYHEVDGKESLVFTCGDSERILPTEEAAKRFFTEAALSKFETMDDLYNATLKHAQLLSQEELLALWNELSSLQGAVEDPEVAEAVRSHFKQMAIPPPEADYVDAEIVDELSEILQVPLPDEQIKYMHKPDGSVVLSDGIGNKTLDPHQVRILQSIGITYHCDNGSGLIQGFLGHLSQSQLKTLFDHVAADYYEPQTDNVIGLSSKKPRKPRSRNNDATA